MFYYASFFGVNPIPQSVCNFRVYLLYYTHQFINSRYVAIFIVRTFEKVLFQ